MKLLRLFPIALTLAALTAMAAPASAQLAPADTLPVDAQVLVGRLANGLTYYIRENRKPEARAELRLVVNAGSTLENERQLGLAHFVEHMAFNGTKNFAKHELIDYLESIGMRFGADLNAYTSFDETVYMLTVPTDSGNALQTGLQILEDWAHQISFDQEEVEKERGVVIEEWRLGQGAEERMRDEYFPVLFRDSRYATRLPIGTRANLESFKLTDLTDYYREYYRPDLMSVVAVGDFDKQQVEALIKQHFSKLARRSTTPPQSNFPVPDHDSTLVAITTDAEATLSVISLYYKLPVDDGPTVADYRARLMGNLFNIMLNARLRELTQQSNPPFLGASSAQGRLIRTKEAYFLSAATRDDEILRGFEALLTEAERVRRFGFTESEVERAKSNMLRFMEAAHAEREKTESREYADEYVNAFLEADPIPGIEHELALTQALLPTITTQQVNQLVDQWMGDANRVIVVQAPEKEGVRVPTDTEIQGVFAAVKQRQLAAYQDDVGAAQLVESLPAPGRVVSERNLAEAGVTEWRLSNGARVLLKPTDFQADEIVMTAYSPGGSSLVEDRDYVSMLLAGTLVGQSGIGQFSATQLTKALAGKVARVSPYLGSNEEGLTGSASPRDLETMLELTYLMMTSPRRDSAAFNSVMARFAAFLENADRDPETAFRDTVGVTMAQHHFRFRPFTKQLLGEFDMERALTLYQQRYANAGDFTFVLVGNFTPDSIKPLIEQYLGALPANGNVEKPRDRGVRPPTGIVEKVVRRGIEPKSQTQIIFSGPLQPTLPNRLGLSLLSEVLDIRLRDVLREDLSGTYGANVGSNVIREPYAHYTLNIGFSADPQRLEALTKTVFEQIEKLKQDGITAAELAKVKETQRREWETNMKRNGYWAEQIAARDRIGEPIADILSFPQRLDTATPEMVQSAARAFLRLDNYVRVSLYPEN